MKNYSISKGKHHNAEKNSERKVSDTTEADDSNKDGCILFRKIPGCLLFFIYLRALHFP
jgi:hypothetical protein